MPTKGNDGNCTEDVVCGCRDLSKCNSNSNATHSNDSCAVDLSQFGGNENGNDCTYPSDGACGGLAVKDACDLRFRPIIMTSLSTMIAMIPLVVGNIGPGAGEGSRLAVGATILGGMLISTFFTLYVTPTMYVALAKNTKRIDVVDIELKKQLR